MLETGFYAGFLALIYIFLTYRVVRLRMATKTHLGDGGHLGLITAVRAHGNFAEYVPLALILMTILNMQGTNGGLIHIIGLTLVAGRMIHAYSISQNLIKLRPVGMILTLSAMALASILLIIGYVSIATT